MPKLDQRKTTMSAIVKNTREIDLHRRVFRQMAYDSTEKAEKYKAEKESLEQELAIYKSFENMDDPEIEELNSIFNDANLERDRNHVTSFKKENPKLFKEQNPKKNQKASKN